MLLGRALLGPGRLTGRIRDLEETRAVAVRDSAATLRRIERDLHDGAQARLIAVAMSLTRARDALAPERTDAAKARELVDHSSPTPAPHWGVAGSRARNPSAGTRQRPRFRPRFARLRHRFPDDAGPSAGGPVRPAPRRRGDHRLLLCRRAPHERLPARLGHHHRRLRRTRRPGAAPARAGQRHRGAGLTPAGPASPASPSAYVPSTARCPSTARPVGRPP
ncbi:histidine kinase [Streptomyces sp. M10(2022)]